MWPLLLSPPLLAPCSQPYLIVVVEECLYVCFGARYASQSQTQVEQLLKIVMRGKWISSSWTAMLGRTSLLANELINFQATHVQFH